VSFLLLLWLLPTPSLLLLATFADLMASMRNLLLYLVICRHVLYLSSNAYGISAIAAVTSP
jgi:hypothetical protein